MSTFKLSPFVVDCIDSNGNKWDLHVFSDLSCKFSSSDEQTSIPAINFDALTTYLKSNRLFTNFASLMFQRANGMVIQMPWDNYITLISKAQAEITAQKKTFEAAQTRIKPEDLPIGMWAVNSKLHDIKLFAGSKLISREELANYINNTADGHAYMWMPLKNTIGNLSSLYISSGVLHTTETIIYSSDSFFIVKA